MSDMVNNEALNPEASVNAQEESAVPAEESQPQVTPPAKSSPVLSIPATITKQVYESIKQYLIPPFIKVIWIVVLVMELVTGIYGVIFEGSYFSLVMMLLLGGFMVFFYFQMQKSTIKNIVKTHPELRNHGYRVVITLGSGIRLMNLTTGVERNLAYKEIVSMAETDKAIVCFARKNKARKYLLIPKNEMTEEQHQAVLDILHKRCPQMKKRW